MRFKTANEKHHLKVAQRPLLSRFGMHALNAISAIMTSSKPVSYIPQPPRLVDQRREALRFNQHSLRTQEASLYWLKIFFDGMAVADGRAIRVSGGQRPGWSCCGPN